LQEWRWPHLHGPVLSDHDWVQASKNGHKVVEGQDQATAFASTALNHIAKLVIPRSPLELIKQQHHVKEFVMLGSYNDLVSHKASPWHASHASDPDVADHSLRYIVIPVARHHISRYNKSDNTRSNPRR
jgi:hypothetical protein